MREIINGIFYVMRAGCPWRLLPSDLPPWGTIYRWFAAWRDDGRLERINHALVMADRERVGRDASPSAAIIDSQSVKTTEAGGARGYDAGKRINGRKRHALVDTDGRGLVLEPHPASISVPYLGFPESHGVYGDGSIVVVPAPGHTPGGVITFVTPHNGTRSRRPQQLLGRPRQLGDRRWFNLGEVQIASRVTGNAVGAVDRWPGTVDALAARTEGGDARNLVGDQDHSVGILAQVHRAAQAMPRFDPCAVTIKQLHAIIFPIADENAIAPVDQNGVRRHEFAGTMTDRAKA
jgi:transposase